MKSSDIFFKKKIRHIVSMISAFNKTICKNHFRSDFWHFFHYLSRKIKETMNEVKSKNDLLKFRSIFDYTNNDFKYFI